MSKAPLVQTMPRPSTWLASLGLTDFVEADMLVWLYKLVIFGAEKCPGYRGTSLIRKCLTPRGPPYGYGHRPTIGSLGEAVSYEQVTPATNLVSPHRMTQS